MTYPKKVQPNPTRTIEPMPKKIIGHLIRYMITIS